jgi:probable F420-dependent oxidoreductase
MQVGLFLPMGEDEATGTTKSYQEIRALARQAEQAGFDSIWIMDHLLFRHSGQPTRGVWEGWTVLTALAEATERVMLGTLVLCTTFRNPALLAKMAATLDEISGGRLILGLGAGWHEPEFEAFDFPFDHRVSRFEEALQIIVPLLREGAVDFHGTYYRATNCEIRPRGPSPRGPQILIGTNGPRMLRILARYADMWNTVWLGRPPGPLLERRAAMEAACVAEDRDPATVAVTVGINIAYQAPDQPAEHPEHPERAIHGSPAEVAAALREYEQLGVAHIICSLDQRTPESVAWLAEALRLYHDQGSHPARAE